MAVSLPTPYAGWGKQRRIKRDERTAEQMQREHLKVAEEPENHRAPEVA